MVVYLFVCLFNYWRTIMFKAILSIAAGVACAKLAIKAVEAIADAIAS